MTPHIEADKKDIAKTVLMPGDPLRAKMIANKFLTNPRLINNVRGMLAYTGLYNNKEVTIFASGMGIPSMGIYSYELFNFYDVDNIIRIGSAGSYTKDINLYDIILVNKSYSESNYKEVMSGDLSHYTESDDELNQKIKDSASKLNLRLIDGNVHCTEAFYKENNNFEKLANEQYLVAVEMETFSLFHNAKILNKKASALLTISDSLITKEGLSSEDREKNFEEMIKIALETI